MPDDTRVRLIQCLCPQRHCIIAVAFDPCEDSEAQATSHLYGVIFDLLQSGALNPWCGICGSHDWHTEAGQTAFATIEEATPHLTHWAVLNAIARHELKGLN